MSYTIICIIAIIILFMLLIFDVGVFSKVKNIWSFIGVVSVLAAIGFTFWVLLQARGGTEPGSYHLAFLVTLLVFNAYAGKKRDGDTSKGEIVVPIVCILLLAVLGVNLFF